MKASREEDPKRAKTEREAYAKHANTEYELRVQIEVSKALHDQEAQHNRALLERTERLANVEGAFRAITYIRAMGKRFGGAFFVVVGFAIV